VITTSKRVPTEKKHEKVSSQWERSQFLA